MSRRRKSRVEPVDGALGALIGAGASYILTIPHTGWGVEHPMHWIIAAIGGLVGFAIGMLLAEREVRRGRVPASLPPAVRRKREPALAARQSGDAEGREAWACRSLSCPAGSVPKSS